MIKVNKQSCLSVCVKHLETYATSTLETSVANDPTLNSMFLCFHLFIPYQNVSTSRHVLKYQVGKVIVRTSSVGSWY